MNEPNCDRDMNKVWEAIRHISLDLDGNGKPGMRENISKIMTDIAVIKAIDEERGKQHRQNTTRLNLIIGLLALFCTIVGTILAVNRFQKQSFLLTNHAITYEAKTR